MADLSDNEEDTYGAYSTAYLSWNKVKGASSYEIQRVTITNGSVGLYKKLGCFKSTSFTDYGVRSGSYYRYKIRALNGKYNSAYTAPSAKKGYLETPYIRLEAIKPSYEGIRVRWLGCDGAKAYKLYKSTDNAESYTLIKDSDSFDEIDFDYSYDDLDVKVGEKYYYYLQAYNNEMTSQISNNASMAFKDYDIIVQAGKSENNEHLSKLYSYAAAMAEGYGTKLDSEFKSDDENIVTISIEKESDNYYAVNVNGVSEGYTYVQFVSDISANTKFRVKVCKEPVYDITLKKGETERIEELYGEEGALFYYDDDILEVDVTSDNTDVLTVNDPNSKNFTLTGVKSGEAEVKVKIRFIKEELDIPIIDRTYSVLVVE